MLTSLVVKTVRGGCRFYFGAIFSIDGRVLQRLEEQGKVIRIYFCVTGFVIVREAVEENCNEPSTYDTVGATVVENKYSMVCFSGE